MTRFSVRATLGLGLVIAACAGTVDPGSFSGWLIPEEEVFVGCAGGHDCIPSLTNPKMVSPADAAADYLNDGDRVVGVMTNAGPRAYPHPILDWHEILCNVGVKCRGAGRSLL